MTKAVTIEMALNLKLKREDGRGGDADSLAEALDELCGFQLEVVDEEDRESIWVIEAIQRIVPS